MGAYQDLVPVTSDTEEENGGVEKRAWVAISRPGALIKVPLDAQYRAFQKARPKFL